MALVGTPASPDAALSRVVDLLSEEQERQLAREIELLSATMARSPPPVRPRARVAQGMRARHSQRCPASRGEACRCSPSWEAWVYSRRDKAKIRKTFPEPWEAQAWRREQLKLATVEQLHAPSRITVADAGARWIAMASDGKIRNRSGHHYKPSTLRTIEQDLRLHLIPNLGAKKLTAITRTDLQRLLARRMADGFSASKIRSIVNAARVLFRDLDLLTGREHDRQQDPTRGLRLPAITRGRERVATPQEARWLIQALQPRDRALWATAMYAGLRLGELLALQVRDVDLERRRINVQRSWDPYEGEIAPKSSSGTRPTIITTRLHELLAEHLDHNGRKGRDLFFGATSTRPFAASTIRNRARKAWATAREQQHDAAVPVDPIREIGLHECRHTAVSQMLDAGIPIEKVSKFIGHASITITIDRYAHLLPGGEDEAIRLLDSYHHRHDNQSRRTA